MIFLLEVIIENLDQTFFYLGLASFILFTYTQREKIKKKEQKRIYYKKLLKEEKDFKYEKNKEIKKKKKKEDIENLKKSCYKIDEDILKKDFKNKFLEFENFIKIILSILKNLNKNNIDIEFEKPDYIFKTNFESLINKSKNYITDLQKILKIWEKKRKIKKKEILEIVKENKKGNLQINSSFVKLNGYYDSKEYDFFERLFRNLKLIIKNFNKDVKKISKQISININEFFLSFLDDLNNLVNNEKNHVVKSKRKSILDIFMGIAKKNDYKVFLEFKNYFEKFNKFFNEIYLEDIKTKFIVKRKNFFDDDFFFTFNNKKKNLLLLSKNYISYFNEIEKENLTLENKKELKKLIFFFLKEYFFILKFDIKK